MKFEIKKKEKNEDFRVFFSSCFSFLLKGIKKEDEREKECDFGLFSFLRRVEDGKM